MELYKYFFSKIYNWASSNKYDYSPEHTALLFISQSLFFNLLTIANFLETILEISYNQYYYILGLILGILTLLLNFIIFLKDKKYLELIYKNSTAKNIIFIAYLIVTYYLFFYSLSSLAK